MAKVAFYVVYHNVTGWPFMDREQNSYGFEDKDEAQEFLRKHPGCYLSSVSMTVDDAKDILYRVGCKKYYSKQSGKKAQDTTIRDDGKGNKHGYPVNRDTNFHTALLAEYATMDTLAALWEDKFFVFAKLADKYTVHYLKAENESGMKAVFICSDMREFEAFMDILIEPGDNDLPHPYLLPLKDIVALLQDEGVLINTSEERQGLYLSPEMLKEAKARSKELAKEKEKKK